MGVRSWPVGRVLHVKGQYRFMSRESVFDRALLYQEAL
jgi:hypothetical protein